MDIRPVGMAVIMLLLVQMAFVGCGSTREKGPQAEEIRKGADEGMRDLGMEEERHRQ